MSGKKKNKKKKDLIEKKPETVKTQETGHEDYVRTSVAGQVLPETQARDAKEDLKGFSRMKAEMAEMGSSKEKIGYFFYYTKVYFIVGALVLVFLISIIKSFYENGKPVAISYAILNCYDHTTAGDAYSEGSPFALFLAHYDMDGKAYQTHANTAVTAGEKADEQNRDNVSSAAFMQFRELILDDFYDVIITDMDGLIYCVGGEDTSRIYDVDEVLGDMIEDQDIKGHITEIKNTEGNMMPAALDISGTRFVKELDLPYDEVYICFPGTGEENIRNARNLVEYIFKVYK